MTRHGKIPSQAGFEHRTFRFRGGRLNHLANETVCPEFPSGCSHGPMRRPLHSHSFCSQTERREPTTSRMVRPPDDLCHTLSSYSFLRSFCLVCAALFICQQKKNVLGCWYIVFPMFSSLLFSSLPLPSRYYLLAVSGRLTFHLPPSVSFSSEDMW